MSRTIHAVDLYCGAGGITSGLMKVAAEDGIGVNMLAINHWDVAIQTHSANHPNAEHRCMDVEAVDPCLAVPGGRIDLMVAGIKCTNHSNARGGKPSTEQSRADAWTVLRWCQELTVDHLIVENVREFQDWGPLYAEDYPEEKLRGRPIPEKKGQYFQMFLRNLRAMGYKVDYRLLCAAHYGDATTRRRLFIQAKKTRGKIVWPVPSHVAPGELDLYEGAKAWRTARQIIDWTIEGTSIYGRKRPLSPNTMARIYAGLRKFSGLPFMCGAGGPTGQGNPQSVEDPLGTILGENHRALCEPYLVVLRNNCDAVSVDGPVPTLCASGNHIGLCEPFVLKQYNTSVSYASLDRPLPTVCAEFNHLGIVEPFMIEYHGGKDGDRRTRGLDNPIPTLDTSNRFGLCEPFLVQFNGTGGANSVDNPVGTLTTRDRFGLVESGFLEKGDKVFMLDILFRMLQPHELAAAHSFPADYQFFGDRDEQVKQVGNSVPVRLAAALCRAALQ